MAGRITITNGRIENCHTGISLGETDAHVEIDNVHFDKCHTAILQRDPRSALAALKIPADVSHQEFREVIELLLATAGSPSSKREIEVRRSRFWDSVQNTANATAIIQGLIALAPAALTGLRALF